MESEKLTELILRFLDGQLSESEERALAGRIRGDAEVEKLLARLMRLDGNIAGVITELDSQSTTEAELSRAQRSGGRRCRFRGVRGNRRSRTAVWVFSVGGVVAALLLVALSLSVRIEGRARPPRGAEPVLVRGGGPVSKGMSADPMSPEAAAVPPPPKQAAPHSDEPFPASFASSSPAAPKTAGSSNVREPSPPAAVSLPTTPSSPPALERPTVALPAFPFAVLRATGPVTHLTGNSPKQLEGETPLAPGDGVQTGADASAVIRFSDGSTLGIGPESYVRSVQDRRGASRLGVGILVTLFRGTLRAEVRKQRAGHAMVFVTPHAEATVLGTGFTLTVTDKGTRLHVHEGIVRLLRLSDRASVDVRTGFSAMAGPGEEPAVAPPRRFVWGVNLNGRAVRIDGHRWVSHEEAVAAGLSFSASPEHTVTQVIPCPAVDPELAEVLNTAIFRSEASLGITWPLPNGVYEVEMWVMENLKEDHRAFDIRVEGLVAARNVGRRAKVGDWARLGPVRAAVQDGLLHVDLVKRKADPHLMGIAVFEAP